MRRNSFISTALLIFLFTGCNVIQSSEDKEISEENLNLAAQIIGSTLSDEEGGVISTLYDAASDIHSRGISYHSDIRNDIHHPGNQHGRGDESDYTYVYDPDTGEHTVNFVRNMEQEHRVRMLTVESVYIYTDADGNFLEMDRRSEEGRNLWDQVETIEYRSTREGKTENPSQFHEFFRSDDLFFEGVSSPVITLEGEHNANGSKEFKIKEPDCPGSGSYEIFLSFNELQLDKSIVENNGSIEDALSGFIHFEITVNGDHYDGIIDLEEGNAWVQFYRIPDFFRIALADGRVTHNAQRGQRGEDGEGNQHGHGDDENDENKDDQ